MARPVRWGVLGVSNFAVSKFLPGALLSGGSEICAIASRDLARGRKAADALGIERAYGSYEELLADPDIDAVYNPLPNHLHTPWSIRAADAGKHVLCEKPISLTTGEFRSLVSARDRNGVLIAEAFMIRHHPQWKRAMELVRNGLAGEVRAVTAHFSYFNRKPENVRNIASYGGGGMWDIGCYGVNVARLVFGSEPLRVISQLDRDPEFGVDRVGSVLMEFSGGRQAMFLCGTQIARFQRVEILGVDRRIELDIPFNAIPGEKMRVLLDDGSDLRGGAAVVEEVEACDQYTLEAEGFSRAVRGEVPLVNSLEETFGNTATLEAIFRSAASGSWEVPEKL